MNFYCCRKHATFPGCSDEGCTQSNILRHISRNFKYPQLKDYGIEGRVIATFVVNKKGRLLMFKYKGAGQKNR